MQKSELIAYCLSKPGAYEDYPFGPDTLVLKVKNKMFALLSTDPDTTTVNLKCDPDHAMILRNVYPDDIAPGYHMNKKHWNTVNFSGGVPVDELKELVDESYDLVFQKLSKKDRVSLT